MINSFSYGFQDFVDVEDFSKEHPYLYPFKHSLPSDFHPNNPPRRVSDFLFICEVLSLLLQIYAVFVLACPRDWGEALQILSDVIACNGQIHFHESAHLNEEQVSPLHEVAEQRLFMVVLPIWTVSS